MKRAVIGFLAIVAFAPLLACYPKTLSLPPGLAEFAASPQPSVLLLGEMIMQGEPIYTPRTIMVKGDETHWNFYYSYQAFHVDRRKLELGEGTYPAGKVSVYSSCISARQPIGCSQVENRWRSQTAYLSTELVEDEVQVEAELVVCASGGLARRYKKNRTIIITHSTTEKDALVSAAHQGLLGIRGDIESQMQRDADSGTFAEATLSKDERIGRCLQDLVR